MGKKIPFPKYAMPDDRRVFPKGSIQAILENGEIFTRTRIDEDIISKLESRFTSIFSRKESEEEKSRKALLRVKTYNELDMLLKYMSETQPLHGMEYLRKVSGNKIKTVYGVNVKPGIKSLKRSIYKISDNYNVHTDASLAITQTIIQTMRHGIKLKLRKDKEFLVSC